MMPALKEDHIRRQLRTPVWDISSKFKPDVKNKILSSALTAEMKKSFTGTYGNFRIRLFLLHRDHEGLFILGSCL